MAGLEGLKVVDLTIFAAAPGCARLLGELGATVYKIEREVGDDQRTQGVSWGMKFKTDIDDAAFDCGGFNRKWVSLNLKTDKGMEVMLRLLSEADVFITSNRTPALERLGLDYETLHKKFPRLVWAQLRGYGERGEMANEQGYDAITYSARGGVTMSFPNAGEHFEVGNSPVAFGDWNSSNALAVGVLAALWNAERTGVGDKVVTSLYHVSNWGMMSAICAQQQGQQHPKNRAEAPCPTNNSYVTSDGVWFVMCFGNYNKFCRKVFECIGMDPKYWQDPEYNNLEALAKNGNNVEVIAEMERIFKQKTWAEWEPFLAENELACEKCRTVADVLEDKEAFDNDQLRRVRYDDQGYGPDHSYTITTAPVRLASLGDPVLYRSRPVGYDTREVLEGLGYSDEEIAAADADGSIKCYQGAPMPPSVLEPSYGISPANAEEAAAFAARRAAEEQAVRESGRA
ncbi:MAG: CaiB/BaiF CoA transferase family protein [Eggerthellaceae bacterium]